MASLKLMIQSGEVCRCIRAKTLFYETDEQEETDAGTSGPFWCSRTQSSLGPDGAVVDVTRCQPGRSCCETA
ncbi:MAG: hypothetical protein HY704_00910 [Gemmatimonadetes bacterium]|nr:hypothetical protein [Gemmatimonadota bacterium]